MSEKRKAGIKALLKGIETGDPESVTVVNPKKYIQHNPLTREGGIGLAELFKRLAQTSPKVEIVRCFSDGDFVFAHTEYDFKSLRVGFELFRFEGDFTVEHWDNIAAREGPNPAGRTMTDGPTEATDLDKTEANRALLKSFMERVFIGRDFEKMGEFVAEDYIEHNPHRGDGLDTFRAALEAKDHYIYEKNHRLLAEGNFALSICEGYLDGQHSSFFDLFRIADGQIVEHWDTVDHVPDRAEWVNENGKF